MPGAATPLSISGQAGIPQPVDIAVSAVFKFGTVVLVDVASIRSARIAPVNRLGVMVTLCSRFVPGLQGSAGRRWFLRPTNEVASRLPPRVKPLAAVRSDGFTKRETLLCCECVGHEYRVRTKSTCVPDRDLGGGFRVKASAKEDRESIGPTRRAESVGTNDRCHRRGRLR